MGKKTAHAFSFFFLLGKQRENKLLPGLRAAENRVLESHRIALPKIQSSRFQTFCVSNFPGVLENSDAPFAYS